MESRTKAAASARFQKSQRGKEPAKNVFTTYESEARAVDARTAKLKVERLARDAELGADGAKKPRAAAKKSPVRKGVGSY